MERLLAAYSKKVVNLAYRMTGRREDAEDLAQAALVEILKSVAGFGGRSRFSTWAYRVALNVIGQELRKRRMDEVPLLERESIADPLPASDPVIHTERAELHDRVNEALQKLPTEQREVVLLHVLHQLTHTETAAALGCPVGTVKSRLSGAFRKLRALLGEYEAQVLEVNSK
jgi:RNA polymerase sigma-70 factor (ECF subfamily)